MGQVAHAAASEPQDLCLAHPRLRHTRTCVEASKSPFQARRPRAILFERSFLWHSSATKDKQAWVVAEKIKNADGTIAPPPKGSATHAAPRTKEEQISHGPRTFPAKIRSEIKFSGTNENAKKAVTEAQPGFTRSAKTTACRISAAQRRGAAPTRRQAAVRYRRHA